MELSDAWEWEHTNGIIKNNASIAACSPLPAHLSTKILPNDSSARFWLFHKQK